MPPTPSPHPTFEPHFRIRRPRHAVPYIPSQHTSPTAQPVTPLVDGSVTEDATAQEPGIGGLTDEESVGEDVGSEFEPGADDIGDGGIEEG